MLLFYIKIRIFSITFQVIPQNVWLILVFPIKITSKKLVLYWHVNMLNAVSLLLKKSIFGPKEQNPWYTLSQRLSTFISKKTDQIQKFIYYFMNLPIFKLKQL